MAEKKDRLKFFKDEQDEWRWQRIAGNNRIVGASTEGYKNRKDCEANAERQQKPTKK